MKTIGVTGFQGQIGTRLVKMGCVPISCNVSNTKETADELHRVNADVIIHLAAMTSVDWCEENYEEAIAINTFGTSVVCQVAEEVLGKGKVVLISTDMVFDGKDGNYKEDDDPHPINNYGLSKFAAEGVAEIYDDKVIRISRCFDSKSKDISAYIESLKNGEKVLVPSHFYRSYCHLDYVANQIFEYAKRFAEMPKILHLGGMSSYSFYHLMSMISGAYGYDPELVIARGEEKGFAPRPFKTGLNVRLARKLGLPMYDMWQSVERLLHE